MCHGVRDKLRALSAHNVTGNDALEKKKKMSGGSN